MQQNELPRWFAGQLFFFFAMLSATAANLYIVQYVRFGAKRKDARASSTSSAGPSRSSKWFSWLASSVKPSGNTPGARGVRDSCDSEEAESWGDGFEPNALDPWVGDDSELNSNRPSNASVGSGLSGRSESVAGADSSFFFSESSGHALNESSNTESLREVYMIGPHSQQAGRVITRPAPSIARGAAAGSGGPLAVQGMPLVLATVHPETLAVEGRLVVDYGEGQLEEVDDEELTAPPPPPASHTGSPSLSKHQRAQQERQQLEAERRVTRGLLSAGAHAFVRCYGEKFLR